MESSNIQPDIEINNMCKFYDNKEALNNINLKIMENEVLVLLGANGSGKSTLLKLISTLYSCDKGKISVLGMDIDTDKTEIQSRTGVLFDSIVHWDKLSGYENAWFFARAYGLTPKNAETRIEHLFKRFKLWDNRDQPVSTYSYGMRRKLALVESMIHEPDVLLLDEPSMGLDYTSRLVLYNILQEELKKSTIILATNDVAEAKIMANRIVLIHEGKILAVDTPKNLINSVMNLNRINLKLSSPLPLNILRNVDGVEYAEADESENNSYKVQFLVKSNKGALANIVNKVVELDGRVMGIDVQEPNLEDVFLKFIDKSL